MTTSTKLSSAELVPPAEPRHQADSTADRRGAQRIDLESAWQSKVSEVITLSKACCGLTSDADCSPADFGAGASSKLRARTDRAYDELTAIEDAIARIDDGTYGMCVGCGRTMPDERLVGKPAVQYRPGQYCPEQYCPDCSARLVSWQQSDLRKANPSATVKRGWSKPGPGVQRRRRQSRRPVSVD
jgi:RNA polymerase-binding transcription factor DksA